MTCPKEKDVSKMQGRQLMVMTMSGCKICAAMAYDEMTRRANEKREDESMKSNGTNMSRGQGQWVNAKPTVRTAHDLSLLIRNKSGDGPRVVVKNVDSKTLNDILDIADEIVISRVDAK